MTMTESRTDTVQIERAQESVDGYKRVADELERARNQRDAAIAACVIEAGMTSGAVARETGLSESLVRLIVRVEKARRK